MKRSLSVFLAVILLLSLSACAGKTAAETKYICVNIEGEVYQKPKSEWILLKPNGKGSMQIRIELNITWEQDGDEIVIKTEFLDNTYEGTLIDDVLTLQVDEQTFTFVPEDMEDEYNKSLVTPVVTEPTEPKPIDTTMVGHYVCTQVTDKEGEELYSNGEWLDLLEDGSCTVCTYARMFGTWSTEDGNLTIQLRTGEEVTGLIREGKVTIQMNNKKYTFKRDNDAEPEAIPHNTEQRGLLQVGSRWKGTVTLEEHKGNGVMPEGTFNIVAQMKEVKGKIYFEAYYESDQNGRPILSFPLTLHPRYILPEIEDDSEDAWIYDVPLTSKDTYTFTMIIDTENKLKAVYEDYRDEDDRFETITFDFIPDE